MAHLGVVVEGVVLQFQPHKFLVVSSELRLKVRNEPLSIVEFVTENFHL